MAHPLGNFTTNAAVRVVFGQDQTQVRYVLDLAEIPTVQARQRLDVNGDDDVTDDEADAYALERCSEVGPLLTVEIDGVRETLQLAPISIDFPEGQAGLLTTRIVCDGVADVGVDRPSEVLIRDDNGLDRVGWREITITGDRVRIQSSDAPDMSSTQLLRMYPEGSLNAPARQVTATATAAPGGPAAAVDVLDPAAVDDNTADAADQGFFERMTTRYTDLIARQELTPGFILLAVFLAILLGAAHAVAPGHGKTVMAAYVVGERGSTRQALAIGATVAMTHTVGTLLLGVALQASETLAPERLYPIFGLISGALIVTIGATLLRSGLRRRSTDQHNDHGPGDHQHHDHGDDHGHDDDDHAHGDDHGHDGDDHGDDGDHDAALAMAEPGTIIRHHGHTHVIPDADMSWRQLIALGVAGGLAPSPSALLVLLGAIALGRTALGVGLVAAYGLGLALVLVGGGLLLVRFRKVGERILARGDSTRLGAFTRWLPVATGLAVIAGGIIVAVRGFLVA